MSIYIRNERWLVYPEESEVTKMKWRSPLAIGHESVKCVTPSRWDIYTPGWRWTRKEKVHCRWWTTGWKENAVVPSVFRPPAEERTTFLPSGSVPKRTLLRTETVKDDWHSETRSRLRGIGNKTGVPLILSRVEDLKCSYLDTLLRGQVHRKPLCHPWVIMNDKHVKFSRRENPRPRLGWISLPDLCLTPRRRVGNNF